MSNLLPKVDKLTKDFAIQAPFCEGHKGRDQPRFGKRTSSGRSVGKDRSRELDSLIARYLPLPFDEFRMKRSLLLSRAVATVSVLGKSPVALMATKHSAIQFGHKRDCIRPLHAGEGRKQNSDYQGGDSCGVSYSRS
jgi:hypothetical protein